MIYQKIIFPYLPNLLFNSYEKSKNQRCNILVFNRYYFNFNNYLFPRKITINDALFNVGYICNKMLISKKENPERLRALYFKLLP